MKTERINAGIYRVVVCNATLEIRKQGARDWHLFTLAQGREEWVNDFPTKRAAMAAAVMVGQQRREAIISGVRNAADTVHEGRDFDEVRRNIREFLEDGLCNAGLFDRVNSEEESFGLSYFVSIV